MNKQEPPRPSENYKILQQQLVETIGTRRRSDSNEIDRLRQLLIKEFQEVFKFKVSTRFPGSRKRELRSLLEDALRAEGHSWWDFDHVDYATCSGVDGQILIAQPYGVATEVHQRLATKFGYTFTQADEWTYYYPGKSHLFIVAAPRDALRRLRKAHRTASFG
jgi:hypothetical protein